jgi:hypothetical protein
MDRIVGELKRKPELAARPVDALGLSEATALIERSR